MGKPQLPDELHARREAFNASLIDMAKQLPPMNPGITTRDIDDVPGCPKMRVYHPPNHNDALPCLVYCHCGGWLSGNLDTEDHMCRVLCVVVSVEYGIFPFVNFPAPIEDCFKACQYVREASFAVEISRSATDAQERLHRHGRKHTSSLRIRSASLSAAVPQVLRSPLRSCTESSPPRDKMSVWRALCPCKGSSSTRRSCRRSTGACTRLTKTTMDLYRLSAAQTMKLALQHIVGDAALNDVSQFPLHSAPDALKGFPRTYIIHTNKEELRDDGTVLEAALKELRVSVRRDVEIGLPHYFWCFPVRNAGQRFGDLLVEGVRWVVLPETEEQDR